MPEINGKTRICGLIGNPVEHTLSPLIHNTLSARTGINMVYVPFQVEQDRVRQAVEGAFALNLLGLNVTVPYKGRVMEYLKAVDPLAEEIGAVNTLVRCEGGYKGYNTDMSGLYRAILSDGIILEGEQVILLGAGGAARAVAFMCAFYGAKQIHILNRTAQKAQELAVEVNRSCCRDCAQGYRTEEYRRIPEGKYLAIQGTSVGLAPDGEKAVIMESEFYRKIHKGYDLVYHPFRTKFMELVEAAGGQAYNGLKMLLYQGIHAYELWNDVEISPDTAELLYAKLKEEMRIHG